jgi:hypothetical protein
MTKTNSIKRLVALATFSALAWAGVPGAYAHHVGASGNKSAAAGMPDGTSMSLDGRLSILDFVYPGGAGQERIYAIVGEDGTVTQWRSPRTRMYVRRLACRVRLRFARRSSSSNNRLRSENRHGSGKSVSSRNVKLLHADNFGAGSRSSGQWSRTATQAPKSTSRADRHEAWHARVVTGARSGTTIAPGSITALTQAPDSLCPRSRRRCSSSCSTSSPRRPRGAVHAVHASCRRCSGVFRREQHRHLLERSLIREQTMTGAVTPWLTAFQRKSTCDYMGIATEARRVAQLAATTSRTTRSPLSVHERAVVWMGRARRSARRGQQYNTLGSSGTVGVQLRAGT